MKIESITFGCCICYRVQFIFVSVTEVSEIMYTCFQSRDKSKPKARDLVQAVHRFLQHLCSDLRELWDWSDFLAFLQSGNAHTRW